MSSHRQRLYVTPDAGPLEPAVRSALEAHWAVVDIDSPSDIPDNDEDAMILSGRAAAGGGHAPSILFGCLGEGIGLITADRETGTGVLEWSDARLGEIDPVVREVFVSTCCRSLTQYTAETRGGEEGPPSHSLHFSVDEQDFEAIVSIARRDEKSGAVTAVAGILREITAAQQLKRRILSIDKAGIDLLRIESDTKDPLNLSQRLKLLEEKVIEIVHTLLAFDNFEIRIIDHETNQLQIVIAHNLDPLKIGEVILAEEEGNGICGFVAATGRSYLCTDVSRDTRYFQGLANAASTLTVPLRLMDRVIGVFNIESDTPDSFDDDDRHVAEVFSHYLAVAMHILDLLVAERHITQGQIAETVLAELDAPLTCIQELAASLHAAARDADARVAIDHITASTEDIRERIAACISGPSHLIGAELEMQDAEPLPALAGCRVLLVDNDVMILKAIDSLLRCKGCDVDACDSGIDAIEKLDAGKCYNLIISDIRMPDCSGYEIFRKSRESGTEVPFVLMTGFGYDPQHTIVRASQEGLFASLFKPLKAAELVDIVLKATAGSR